MIDLPYRIVFAVATTDQIIIYTTDSIVPIPIVGNIHYAPINDMSWQGNKKLLACSSDGYCSVIQFAKEEALNVVGVRILNSNIENEPLRNHYQQMDAVNLKILEKEV